MVDTAVRRANLQVARTLDRIDCIGIRVASRKTEAVLLSRRRGVRSYPDIRVDRDVIQTKKCMKYLGVIIDEWLNFNEHFVQVAEKASKVIRALCRLMLNLRGPGEARRRLYANVVLSVILYAAPIWCDALKASAKSQRIVNKVLHTVAVRVIAVYRTISLDAALLLARIPPLSLMADERRRTAERVSVLRSEGTYDRRCLVGIRVQESDKTLEKWATYLASPGLAGTRTISAILQCLNEWMNRRSGGLTFRLTQVLSGHGCFGSYLHRIRRVPDPTCVACDSIRLSTHCPTAVDGRLKGVSSLEK